MTSKYGKNKGVAHEAWPSVSLMFLPHFDVFCDLIGSRHHRSVCKCTSGKKRDLSPIDIKEIFKSLISSAVTAIFLTAEVTIGAVTGVLTNPVKASGNAIGKRS